MNSVNLVFVCDRNVEVGLHTTLYSLLEKSSFKQHNIFVITTNKNGISIDTLKKTLNPFLTKCIFNLLNFDESIFNNYRGLHGNNFVYTKLVLSDLINVEKILFLDIDIIVNLDIALLKPYFKYLDKYPIIANKECTKGKSLEKNLYLNKLNQQDESYYNTGVMLANLNIWRKKNYVKKFLNFAEKNFSDLKTADQTVINATLRNNDIYNLPEKYNYRVKYNIVEKEYTEKEAILHFYGRPKHWDLFAEFIHPQFKIFKNILDKTYFKRYKSYKKIDIQIIRKFIKTYKSYLKILLKR